MIPTVLGVALVLAGVGLVVYHAGQNWSRRRRLSEAKSGDAPEISYLPVILIGLGAVLILIGTSVAPSAP